MINITTDIKCSAHRTVGTPIMITDNFGEYEIVPYNENLILESPVYVQLGVISKINKNSVSITVYKFN